MVKLTLKGSVARGNHLKLGIVISLQLIFTWLSYYFHTLMGINVVYPHFFYLPIALGALWWNLAGGLICATYACFAYALIHFQDVAAHPAAESLFLMGRCIIFMGMGVLVGAITARRKQAKAKLRQSEKRYKDLIEQAPDGIVTLDIKGFITSCNTAAAKISGYSKDEIVGKHFTKMPFYSTRDIPRYVEMLNSATRGGIPRLIEVCQIHKDGTPIWVEPHMRFLREDGKLVGFEVITRDVTYRKQMEQEKEAIDSIAELFLSSRTLDDIYAELLKIFSSHFQFPMVCIQLYDQVTREMVLVGARGVSTGAPKLPMRVPVDQTTAGTVATTGKAIFTSNGSQQLCCQPGCSIEQSAKTFLCVPMKMGRSVFGTISLADRRKRQDVAHLIDIFQVVTNYVAKAIERKRAEEELAQKASELEKAYRKLRDTQAQLVQAGKMVAMGELAASVAHELNQPLAGILGFSQVMLQEMDKKNPLRKDLLQIEEQSKRMSSIIENVRTFARQSTPQKELISLNAPIKKALDLTQQQLNNHSVEIVTNLSPGLPKAKADSNQLQQVFLNLISNARDALDAAEGSSKKLTITTQAQDGKITTIFADNGCGMDRRTKRKAFEPFFTTKGAETASSGLGLGLSVSYGIIKNHSGEIDISSQKGKGTSVTVSLPVAKS